MTDVLPLLPPSTMITGYVGDKGSYIRFDTYAGTARVDILKVCNAHAANQLDLHTRIPQYVTSPTHPSSHWFNEHEGPVTATLPDDFIEGVTLVLTTHGMASRDVRTDPWIVGNVIVTPPDFSTWDDGPSAAQKAVTYFRKLADFLDTLAR